MMLKISYTFNDYTYALFPDIIITLNNGFGIIIMILNLVIIIELK